MNILINENTASGGRVNLQLIVGNNSVDAFLDFVVIGPEKEYVADEVWQDEVLGFGTLEGLTAIVHLLPLVISMARNCGCRRIWAGSDDKLQRKAYSRLTRYGWKMQHSNENGDLSALKRIFIDL